MVFVFLYIERPFYHMLSLLFNYTFTFSQRTSTQHFFESYFGVHLKLILVSNFLHLWFKSCCFLVLLLQYHTLMILFSNSVMLAFELFCIGRLTIQLIDLLYLLYRCFFTIQMNFTINYMWLIWLLFYSYCFWISYSLFCS